MERQQVQEVESCQDQGVESQWMKSRQAAPFEVVEGVEGVTVE